MKKPLDVKALAIAALFAAITAILAQIAIPLPFTPIPISFGLVAVHMTGVLLRPRYAVAAQLCYLLMGLIGLPVFAGFHGGLGALLGPTGGYLMAYPFMAGLLSVALNGRGKRNDNHQKPRLMGKAVVFMCFAQIILYLLGSAWWSFTTGSSLASAVALTVYPFIPLDSLKIVFCAIAAIPMRSRLRSALPGGSPTQR